MAAQWIGTELALFDPVPYFESEVNKINSQRQSGYLSNRRSKHSSMTKRNGTR